MLLPFQGVVHLLFQCDSQGVASLALGYGQVALSGRCCGLKAQRGIALFHCSILLAVKCFFVPSAHVVLAANGLKAQRAHSPGQAAQSVPTVGVGIGQD